MLQQRPGLPVLEYPFDDVTGLIRLIAHADEPRPLTSRAVRPETLGEALASEIYHSVSRCQDWLRRAIVLVERNNLGRRAELTGEVEDVAHCSRAKRNKLPVHRRRQPSAHARWVSAPKGSRPAAGSCPDTRRRGRGRSGRRYR